MTGNAPALDEVDGIGDDDLETIRNVTDANSFYAIRGSFRHVSETLDAADELDDSIEWDSEVWEGCTVEELVTGIVEAEFMLEAEEQEAESWGGD